MLFILASFRRPVKCDAAIETARKKIEKSRQRLPTGVLSLPLSALFVNFSRAGSRAAPEQTEHLEEAMFMSKKLQSFNIHEGVQTTHIDE